jgi:hypothetical protein
MKNFKLLAIALIIVVTFTACDKDEETILPVNEEELITTVKLTLTGGGQVVTLTSKDLDGDGPNAPVVTVSNNLLANTTYVGQAEFLNELVTPADNLTVEIEEEGVDHQIFYQALASLGTFTYTDVDANGKPIGLSFTYTTNNAASSDVTVTLRHLPNKSASGVATGNITNAGGATDAEVVFPIVVN